MTTLATKKHRRDRTKGITMIITISKWREMAGSNEDEAGSMIEDEVQDSITVMPESRKL